MTTAVRSLDLDLDDLTLQAGGHSSPEQGLCVMEAVAYMAGEKHSDMPQCVSPVLRAYGMRLNDSLPDDRRQALKQFVPALIGTADDGLDQARRDLAQRTVMTEWLPQWLRLAGLDDLAARAERGAALPPAELRRSSPDPRPDVGGAPGEPPQADRADQDRDGEAPGARRRCRCRCR